MTFLDGPKQNVTLTLPVSLVEAMNERLAPGQRSPWIANLVNAELTKEKN